MDAIEGGCLCGAVRYRIMAEPSVTRICWCRLCQYIGAGSGTVNAAFPTAAMTVTGELADYASVADSGNAMHRRFCPRCGTHLFSEAEVRPHVVMVRVGTLDEPARAKPAMTIWTGEAPPWACLNGALPAFAGQPPPAG